MHMLVVRLLATPQGWAIFCTDDFARPVPVFFLFILLVL
jgi:hypothetical protein